MAPMPGCLSKIYSALWLQQFGAAGKDLHGVRFSNRFMRQLFFRRFISDQPGLLAGLRGFDRQGGDCLIDICLLYTSPSPRDRTRSRMPSSA